MDRLIGEIIYVPWGWAMTGCMTCSGQTLQVQNHAALFSLLGNAWGGDGQHTFALPDMRPIDENGQQRAWHAYGELVPHMVIDGMYPRRD
jgi:microcystin-dependent protein